MPAYTYAIETTDDGRTWMPEAGATGTEEYDGGAEAYAEAVLDSRLADGDETGPADSLRVVVWDGGEQDSMSMAAAVAYSGHPMTTKELAEAIGALPAMSPVERALAVLPLMDAARGILAAERAAAMLEATTGPGAVSRAELARRLGVSRQQVTKAITDHG